MIAYDAEEIGARIKERRRKLGITQPELARGAMLGHKQAVYRIERGTREPTPEQLKRIAAALFTTPAYLKTGEEPMPEEVSLADAEKADKLILRSRKRERTVLGVYDETAEAIRCLSKRSGIPIADLMEQIIQFTLEHIEVI